MNAKELGHAHKLLLSMATENTFEELLKILGGKAEGRTGGMFQLWYATDATAGLRGWEPLSIFTVGKKESFQSVDNFSTEKCLRLMRYHAFDTIHVSSHQSRDPVLQQFGGAVILSANIPELGGEVKILLSFSGLPDTILGDETLDLLVAKKMGWGNDAEYRTITQYSNNLFVAQLLGLSE